MTLPSINQWAIALGMPGLAITQGQDMASREDLFRFRYPAQLELRASLELVSDEERLTQSIQMTAARYREQAVTDLGFERELAAARETENREAQARLITVLEDLRERLGDIADDAAYGKVNRALNEAVAQARRG